MLSTEWRRHHPEHVGVHFQRWLAFILDSSPTLCMDLIFDKQTDREYVIPK